MLKQVFVSFFLATFAFLISANAAPIIETLAYKEVQRQTERFALQYGYQNVLVALDIDNTILSLNQDLGSEQWFKRQAEKVTANAPDRIANSIDELLDLQHKVYALSKSHATVRTLPSFIAKLQLNGSKVIAVTSRRTDIRDVTMRSLLEAGYDFRKNPLGKKSFPGEYFPIDPNDVQRSGFSDEEFVRFDLRNQRLVSYSNGIYMTSGLHKGAMLRALITKLGLNTPKAIVFVDDTERHLIGLNDASENRDVDIAPFRFTGKRAEVDAFNTGEKARVQHEWQLLSNVISSLFQ